MLCEVGIVRSGNLVNFFNQVYHDSTGTYPSSTRRNLGVLDFDKANLTADTDDQAWIPSYSRQPNSISARNIFLIIRDNEEIPPYLGLILETLQTAQKNQPEVSKPIRSNIILLEDDESQDILY